MIFIWFLARSSRVTGPKMRVPIGSPCGVHQHGGIAVEADQAAVGTAHAIGGAHDDGLQHFALLHAAARDCFLHADTTMVSPTSA